MVFSSSPVVYPPSSSPAVPLDAAASKKRVAEDLDAPKPKKRLFGTTLWDAANILKAKPTDSKEPEKKGTNSATEAQAVTAKRNDTEPVPLKTAVHEQATKSLPAAPRSRAVFVDPRQANPDLIPTNFGSGETAPQTSNEPTWSFSRATDPSARTELRGRTCSGKLIVLCRRTARESQSYERTIAARSVTAPGRATTSYYGVDIHKLVDEANALNQQQEAEQQQKSIPPPDACVEKIVPSVEGKGKRRNRHAMWTEKYRARRFVDLVGDERTHRTVLRWLKGWDSIVFPGSSTKPSGKALEQQGDDDRVHRKILLLTGPPGLGKTTLAHVCARQAGYEVLEINASDERSREVVKGRIRDSVGTENVRGVDSKVGEKTVRKAGRPVCVVVDEVDGVASGSSGSGDGGFMKALVDLVLLDQKNASQPSSNDTRRKKGDRFRLLRPIVLICNDVYHPSLRPLRSSNLAEIVHVRSPPLGKVVARLKTVFDREAVPADTDGVRRLCEAAWGVSNKRDDEAARGAGEGDLRGILVVGEWAARKLAASGTDRLTRQWVEKHMIPDLSTSGSGARSIGRGGTRETADRVFLEHAGFSRSAVAASATAPAPTSATEALNQHGVASVSNASRAQAMHLLRAAIDTTGEADRIVNEVFTQYPLRPFQDDTFLSKPNAAAEWLHFADTLSSRVFAGQEWELAPYLSTPILGFHSLFGTTNKFNAAHSASAAATADVDAEPLPFSGPRADFEAGEALKATRATLQSVRGSLSLPLYQAFRGPAQLATELVPRLATLLAPAVNPVIIGGSGGQRGTASVRRDGEKRMVHRAAAAMCATGVAFEKARIEDNRGGIAFVLRMEPPVDELATYATATATATASAGGGPPPARYAVRQVLDQEHARLQAQLAATARLARVGGAAAGIEAAPAAIADIARTGAAAATIAAPALKRDFFGRPLATPRPGSASAKASAGPGRATIWVTFHEGFSNAVRKPLGMAEVLNML